MPWTNSHLHMFFVGNKHYTANDNIDDYYDAHDISLKAVFTGLKKIRYLYDMGDSWEHSITLEKIFDKDESINYPICKVLKGDAPIEDFDLEAYEILQDKNHVDYEHTVKEYTEDYGYEEKWLRSIHRTNFSLEDANDDLTKFFSKRKNKKRTIKNNG